MIEQKHLIITGKWDKQQEHTSAVNFLKIYILLKFLVDTCPFIGPLIPLFWTSGDVSCGFQSHSGQPYLHLPEAYIMYIP